MLLAQHPFPQRQRLTVNPLGLFVAALTAQHPCQIIHARQDQPETLDGCGKEQCTYPARTPYDNSKTDGGEYSLGEHSPCAYFPG